MRPATQGVPLVMAVPTLYIRINPCKSINMTDKGGNLDEARLRLLQDISSRVEDKRVIEAMGKIPRENFVAAEFAGDAYQDAPLPIGDGQTVSQPTMIAIMVSALELRHTDRVLEIGTGSGYQTAILATMSREVISIERISSLAEPARERLLAMGYTNVTVYEAEDELGYMPQAPYDAIIVTCAPDHVPQPLVDQLKIGGRMCIPVGPAWQNQDLYLLIKKADGELVRQKVLPVVFVPLTGEHGVER